MDIQIIREAKFLNLQYTNDEGIEKPWELKYITLDDKDLKIRDGENEIVKTTIHLYDINLVEEEIRNANTNETIVEISKETDGGIEMVSNQQILLKIKTNCHSSIMWKLEMDNQEMYDRWAKCIEVSKVKQKQRELIDLESSANITTTTTSNKYESSSSPSYNYNKKKVKCCSIDWFFKGYKFWITLAFIIYTIAWVALFGSLWVYLNRPVIGINAVETQCFIDSTDWYIIVSDDYAVTIDVTYTTEDNITRSNTATQYCYSYACLFTIDNQYPSNQNMTCWYDKSDPDFVFFNISEIILYRILLNFTITGTCLIPWFVLFLFVCYFVYQKITGKD